MNRPVTIISDEKEEENDDDDDVDVALKNTDPSPSTFLKAMRLGVLILLWIQISFSILVVDYSRNVRDEKYSNSDVVILSESVKFVISAIVIMITGADSEYSWDISGEQSYTVVRTSDSGPGCAAVDEEAHVSPMHSAPLSITTTANSSQPRTSWTGWSIGASCRTYCHLIRSSRKMILIVVLYAVSNVVALTAVEYLGSGVYNTVNQLKILSTAAFGKIFLNREYSAAKWRALLLLVMGCVLVAAPRPEDTSVNCQAADTSTAEDALHSSTASGVTKSNSVEKQFLGLVCAGIQTLISGFNSVYLESMLKSDRCSIWGRNFQMAFLSIIVLVLSTHAFQSSTHRFMDKWTLCATFTVLIQSAGGLLVAASLKYADAVIKCFASAMSIMFTLLVAYLFLGGYFSLVMFIGCTVTIVSLFNYILDASVV